MNSRQIVEELQTLVETGTRVPGFRRKVLIDIDRLDALGEELKVSIPAYIQEAEEILKQKESILNQAALEAQRIRTSAEQEAQVVTSAADETHETKVGESEVVKASEERAAGIKDEAMTEAQQIVQDARRRAYRIVDEAEAAAGTRREGADQYAREILFSLEERLAEVLGQVRRGIDTLNLEVDAPMQVNGQQQESQAEVVA